MTRIAELTQLADRLRAARDLAALTVARVALRRVVQNDGLDEDDTFLWTVRLFERAQQHVSFADDMRALEVFGMFIHKVTVDVINARWPLASDRAVTVQP